MSTFPSDVSSSNSKIELRESSCMEEICDAKTDVPIKQPHFDRSPEAWSTNSESPTPTNSVVDHPWAEESLWHGLLGDEHRQLLGTEEESSDRHSSGDENETDITSLYLITQEQRKYYLKQFQTVQSDLNGLVRGQDARMFFEKSRIPIEELRHIWQLCDVTRDGALNLSEFTAAMHLVVLRRNNMPLPTSLPHCLHPNILKHTLSQKLTNEPPEADLLHLEDDATEENPTLTKTNKTMNEIDERIKSSDLDIINSTTTIITGKSNISQLSPQSVSQAFCKTNANAQKNSEMLATSPLINKVTNNNTLWSASGHSSDLQSNKWTKFNESPRDSTPQPKPLNFDMQRTAQAVVSDPQILHPVPLRVTPVGVDNQNNCSEKDCATAIEDPSQDESFEVQEPYINNDLLIIQLPQPKKLSSFLPPSTREFYIPDQATNNTSSSYMVNNATNLSTFLDIKKDRPPLPPPRPHRHGRSSSLDLNKYRANPLNVITPEITAQNSFDLQMLSCFADFAHFPENKDAAANAHQQSMTILNQAESGPRVSAFEIYRKPKSSQKSQPITPPSLLQPQGLVSEQLSSTFSYEDKLNSICEIFGNMGFQTNSKNINDLLGHLRAQNNALLRLCSDLSDELLSVQKRKEEIRINLEDTAVSAISLDSAKEFGNFAECEVRMCSSIASGFNAP